MNTLLLLLALCGPTDNLAYRLQFANQAPQSQVYGYHIRPGVGYWANGTLMPCPNGQRCPDCLYFFKPPYLPSTDVQRMPIGVPVGPLPNLPPNSLYYYLRWDSANFRWYKP